MNSLIAPDQVTGLAMVAWTWAAAFAPRLIAAVVILVAGLLLSRWITRGLDKMLIGTRRIDPTLRPVAVAVVRYGLFILIVVLLLNQLGIETTTLLTVLGAAGLAIGLALQGTLSNIAAGIMLLWLRPFTIGDYIEVNNQAGFVEETGLFSCILRTFDGARLFAPNSTVWNFALRNHTRAPRRMLAVSVTLAGDGKGPAAEAIETALRADSRVLNSPEPEVFVETLTNTNVVLTCRFWAKHPAYGALQRSIVDFLNDKLVAAGTPKEDIQLIARVVPPVTDFSRLMDL